MPEKLSQNKEIKRELSVAHLIRDLFYSYGITFKYGAKTILEENKKRARAYTNLVEAYQPAWHQSDRNKLVKEAIGQACKESPKKMPSAYAILSHCRLMRTKNNSLMLAAGEQRGLDKTHRFDFEKGEWLPK